ncbi:hypothetical protein PIB30_077282 [Stylosanthes scabra]|uniref:Uncharacterized protein n=1 Tax=Stylosanthes scabra TaxID=79078 RepID=A0ABU6ZP30_9FABA|nr:hypothetical protein [Stylosanthes scabra]
MDRIKTVMKFEGPLNTEMSYRTRMIEGDQELDAVIRDLCVEGSILKQETCTLIGGLQQGFPSLVPVTPAKIPGAIRNNFRAGKPLFEGMLCPWPPKGLTSAPGQQDPPAVDIPRDQNADLEND